MSTSFGQSGSWAVLLGLAVVVGAQPFGCAGEKGAEEVPEEVKGALEAAGSEAVIPSLEAFSVAAAELVVAADAWAAGGAKADVQTAWQEAMVAWQHVEAMKLGPAASSLTAVGGEDQRDFIYSWPTINPCRVDQELVAESYADSDAYFQAGLVNVMGLDALEHLLFAGSENACPPQLDINDNGSWDDLGDSVETRRAAFSAVLASDVSARADDLLSAWNDGFADELAAAGEDSVFESAEVGLNAIYDALFFLELGVKDRKLGVPLGLKDCTAECEQQAEALEFGAGTEYIVANIDGFELLFTGGEQEGFDDLLVEAGSEDLSERVLANLADARAAALAIEGPLVDAILNDRESVENLHAALVLVADDLKGDVATVLAMQIPQEAAGDND